ncbi:MAG: methyltransferase [Candidatus Heimdallarchaeota archaeon]|nr:methyltransferase [Candidatus Heimdallarchaeota archaeon]
MVRYNFPKYELELDIPEDVYFPAEDTFFMIDTLELKGDNRLVYEIGGGSGIISIIFAQRYKKTRFVITDISITAAKMIQSNCVKNKVTSQIDVLCTDKLNAIHHLSPDAIIWNPPYLPVDSETQQLSITEQLQLTGGEKGYEAAYSIIKCLQKSRVRTSLHIIFSSIAWEKNQLKYFEDCGIKSEIIGELKLFFEKLYLVKLVFGDYNE